MPRKPLAPLAALLLLAAAAPASGASDDARFELFFGGLRAGEALLRIDRDGPRYAAALEAEAADWVTALYRARIAASGEGALEPAPRPERFEVRTRFGGDAQDVDVSWNAAGAPESVAADPPFRPRPWQTDPADHAGAADPISAAVRLLAPRPVDALCDATLQVFDGRRVSRVALGPPQPREGGGWRCEGGWSRVAGFRPKDLARPPIPLRVDYAPSGDGTAHAVRLEVDTGWGLAIASRLPAPPRAAAKDPTAD